MLTLEPIIDLQGQPRAGHFLRNRARKVLGVSVPGKFLVLKHKRYERDADLVRRAEALAGCIARHREVPRA